MGILVGYSSVSSYHWINSWRFWQDFPHFAPPDDLSQLAGLGNCCRRRTGFAVISLIRSLAKTGTFAGIRPLGSPIQIHRRDSSALIAAIEMEEG